MKYLSTNSRTFKRFLVFALLLWCSGKSQLKAQQGWCGAPTPVSEDVQELVDLLRRWNDEGGQPPSTPITIPVAFHIVRIDEWTGEVSDEQIYQQLAILNSRFEQTSFRFSLHSIDRTDNPAWAEHCVYSQSEIAMKNALAIDPAHVLNFYTVYNAWGVYPDNTCNYSYPLFGYAYFPRDFPESSTRHGVVVKYTTLPEGSEQNYDEGIVGVHEVGHFVGLYHTFQGGCEGGDGIADTPPEQYPSYECVERNSCIEPPPDPWDPIHNYMDYSPDACRYEFTPLQADAMYVQMSRWRPFMTGLEIVVDQWNENNNVMVGSTISRWETGWADYTVGNDEPKLRFFPGTSEYLRGYQDVLLSPTEKYHKWRSSSDVTNFHRFDITLDFFIRQTSQFKRTHDATIEARFIDGGSGDAINFTDPWFIDFNDPTYGMRNRGLQAVPPFSEFCTEQSWHQYELQGCVLEPRLPRLESSAVFRRRAVYSND